MISEIYTQRKENIQVELLCLVVFSTKYSGTPPYGVTPEKWPSTYDVDTSFGP